MQIGLRGLHLTICGVGVWHSMLPTLLSSGSWVGFFLWDKRQRIILGIFCLFVLFCFFVFFPPIWAIPRFFPSAGALSGESSDGIRWASSFPLIAEEGLLMDNCLCWWWQTPGMNENLKEGALTDPEERTHLLPNFFCKYGSPDSQIFVVLKNWKKKHNSSIYCFAYG